MVTWHARIELQHPRTSNSREQTKDIRLLRIEIVYMRTYQSACQVNSHSSAVFSQCDFRERIQADSSRVVIASWKRHLAKERSKCI